MQLDFVLKNISERIHHILENDIIIRPSVRIMLCGADKKKTNSVRVKVEKFLKTNSLALMIRLNQFWLPFYEIDEILNPEDLFGDEISGFKHKETNLLSFENQLADIVDAVIIVLESAGAIAELGAFSNHSKLNKKLIVIVDQKYNKEKSFINYGPLKLLKQNKLKQVLKTDFSSISYEIIPEIFNALDRIIEKNKLLKENNRNKLEKYRLTVLLLLFLLDDFELNMGDIYTYFVNSEKENHDIILPIINNLSFKMQYIKMTGDKLKLSNIGYSYILSRVHNKSTLDLLRINLLNSILRNRNLSIGRLP